MTDNQTNTDPLAIVARSVAADIRTGRITDLPFAVSAPVIIALDIEIARLTTLLAERDATIARLEYAVETLSAIGTRQLAIIQAVQEVLDACDGEFVTQADGDHVPVHLVQAALDAGQTDGLEPTPVPQPAAALRPCGGASGRPCHLDCATPAEWDAASREARS